MRRERRSPRNFQRWNLQSWSGESNAVKRLEADN